VKCSKPIEKPFSMVYIGIVKRQTTKNEGSTLISV